MTFRPRIFDDFAGFAGTAFSAAQGMREEMRNLVRSHIDEILYNLDLVNRSEFEAVQEMASRARQSQKNIESRLAQLEERLETLEQAVTDPQPRTK